MPIQSRPGFTPPGFTPPQTPIPPVYDPPVAPYVPPATTPATGGSNLVQPGASVNDKTPIQLDGFFGFVLLMMGLN